MYVDPTLYRIEVLLLPFIKRTKVHQINLSCESKFRLQTTVYLQTAVAYPSRPPLDFMTITF